MLLRLQICSPNGPRASSGMTSCPDTHTAAQLKSWFPKSMYLPTAVHEQIGILSSFWGLICTRLGMAYLALHEYTLAAQSFSQGLQLDPSNKEMAVKKGEAKAHALYEHTCLQAHFGAQKRDLVLNLRVVRHLKSIPSQLQSQQSRQRSLINSDK